MIQNLIKPGATHIFVGSESQHQTTLALDLVFRALAEGYVVVGLVETDSEGSVLQSRARLWLRAMQHAPAHNDAITYVKDYRHFVNPPALANAILKAVKAIPEDADFPHKGIVVFYDGAAEMQAMTPDAHIFKTLDGARDGLAVNTIIVSTAHTGSDALPPQPLATFIADRVFKVQSPGVSLAITVTPIKPVGYPLHLQGRIHEGGVITITERETSNV
jgi:hypothetical protein